MAILYLDTEFNGPGGALLSLALVRPDGPGWYAAQRLPAGEDCHPWVAENVLPVLNVKPLDPDEFRASFRIFIRHFYEPTVVCTAPADGMHFLSLMDRGSGPATVHFACDLVIMTPPSGALRPAVPHNALSDAVALMAWHQRMIGGETVARAWL